MLADPAKAVRFTLLQRDVANDRDKDAAEISSVQTSVNQEYDLMKWIVGTLVIGIVSLVITGVVKFVVPTPRQPN